MRGGSLQHFTALLRFARPYRRAVGLQFTLMGISVGFALLKPWPMKVLVDSVVGEDPFVLFGWSPEWGWELLLLAACLAYLLFHAGESLVQVGSGTIAALTSAKMIRDLRSTVLRRLQELSLRFHDDHKVGDLVHRVTYNTTAAETAFQSGFMGAVKSGIMLAAMFFVMLWMNVLLTIVAVAVVPLLVITIRWYARKTHQVALDHQNQEGRLSSLLQEILSSIRLVKAFHREKEEQTRFDDSAKRSVETRLKSEIVQRTFGFCTAVILALGTSVMFYAGILQVKEGNLTIGEFLVFVAYLAMLYAPLSVLSYTASSVQGALGGATRLFQILETEPEVKEAPNPVNLDAYERDISVQGVTFSYVPGKPVLHGIDLVIARGEMLAVAGETGGGKSTLLSLLLRFYDPDSGAIEIDGVDIRQVSMASLRRLVSYVPQDTILFSGSIRENIAYARPDATDAEVERAAKQAQAHDFILECPSGYETLVGERGIRLSMGQRQRIALARAFLKDAPILLLDEPTSALDAETEARIMETIESNGERTVVVVAHRLSTILHANRIAVISKGRIAEVGSHDALLAADGTYARLWRTQASGFEVGHGGALP